MLDKPGPLRRVEIECGIPKQMEGQASSHRSRQIHEVNELAAIHGGGTWNMQWMLKECEFVQMR